MNDEDIPVTVPVNETLYRSALYQYLVNTDNKIIKECGGAVSGSRDERLFKLLCTFVEREWEAMKQIEDSLK